MSEQKNMISVLDITGVKDVKKLKIPQSSILIEVIERKVESGIIMPSGLAPSTDRATFKIIKVAENVKGYNEGDLVLDFKSQAGVSYLEVKDGGKYILTDSFNIGLGVEDDNYEPPKPKQVKKL